MTKINAILVQATVPPDLHVGDRLELSGTARVTGIEEALVDITPIDGDADYLPGERTISLLVSDAVLAAPTSAPPAKL